MKIFLAGATGVIGRRLIPLLVGAGHNVTGTTRTPNKAGSIRSAGATPVVLNALNSAEVSESVRQANPDVLIHELTSIPSHFNMHQFGREFADTNRLRTEGTDNLLAAAQTTGCRRFIAQSYTGWPYERIGGWTKAEDAPLLSDPEPELRESLKAIVHLESAVLQQTSIAGVVLRYGTLYGPGTSLSPGGSLLEDIRRRRVPMIGGGTAHWSFLHIDDAASSTLAAVESSVSGLFNIADDEPAPVSDWLSFLANVLGAKPPLRIPAWLGRIAAGPHGVAMMTEGRGALNAKAKAQIPLRLKWPSWRAGFRRGLGSTEEIPTSGLPYRFGEQRSLMGGGQRKD